MAPWKYSKGWSKWSKKVFSEQSTFPCCTASQSRGSTRGPPFTTCVKLCQMHKNFQILKFRVYLISYTKLFTKLKLQNLILCCVYIYIYILQWKFPDLVCIYLVSFALHQTFHDRPNFISSTNQPKLKCISHVHTHREQMCITCKICYSLAKPYKSMYS